MNPIFLNVQMVKAQIAVLRHNHPELETDARLLEDSLEGETDFREIVAKLIRLERDAASFSKAIKAQEEELAERRARFVKHQQSYRSMIHALMDAAGQTSLRLPEATLTVSNGRAGCTVTDITSLPDEFVKIERIPKKAEILAVMLAGERVPGAEMKNGATHLTIRI